MHHFIKAKFLMSLSKLFPTRYAVLYLDGNDHSLGLESAIFRHQKPGGQTDKQRELILLPGQRLR